MAETNKGKDLDNDRKILQIYDVAKRFLGSVKADNNDYLEIQNNNRKTLLMAYSNKQHAVVLDALASLLRENKANSDCKNDVAAIKLCCGLLEEANSNIRVYSDAREGKLILEMIEFSNENLPIEATLFEYLFECIYHEGRTSSRSSHECYTEEFRMFALEATLRLMEKYPNTRGIQFTGMKLLSKVASIFFNKLVYEVGYDERAVDRILIAMDNFENDVEIQTFAIRTLTHTYRIHKYTDPIPAKMKNGTEVAERVLNVLRLLHHNEEVQHEVADALCLAFRYSSKQPLHVQKWILLVPSIVNVIPLLRSKNSTNIYFVLKCIIEKDQTKVAQAIIDAGGITTLFDGFQKAFIQSNNNSRCIRLIYIFKCIEKVVIILIQTGNDLVIDKISQTDGLLSDIITAYLHYRRSAYTGNGSDIEILNLAQVKVQADGRIPLHFLASFQNDPFCRHFKQLKMVRSFLIEYPDGCRVRDTHGNLPLHLAIKTNASIDVVRVLMNSDTSTTTIPDGDGNLMIELACPWDIFELIHKATPPSL